MTETRYRYTAAEDHTDGEAVRVWHGEDGYTSLDVRRNTQSGELGICTRVLRPGDAPHAPPTLDHILQPDQALSLIRALSRSLSDARMEQGRPDFHPGGPDA